MSLLDPGGGLLARLGHWLRRKPRAAAPARPPMGPRASAPVRPRARPLDEVAAEAELTLPWSWEDVDPDLRASVDARIARLDSLPLGTVRILSALDEPGVSIARVARIVARDPGVAAEIFRVVNSAAFGLRKPVGDVHRALVVLGYTQVRSIAMRLGVERAVGRRAELDALWRHSHLTCEALQAIAAPLGGSRAHAWFTAALMHDLGKLLRADLGGGDGVELENDALSAGERIELEQRETGVPHTVLGERLSLRLRLPELVRDVQLHHHHPPRILARAWPGEERLYATVAVRLASELARDFVAARSGEQGVRIGTTADPARTRAFSVPDVEPYREVFPELPDWVALAATAEPLLERASALFEER